MAGHVVYVIGLANISRVKIGTSKDVSKRLADIQRMSPEPLEVLWQTPGTYRLEGALHSRFADRRVHGEWFDFAGESPVKLIEEAVNAFNHSSRLIARWMMADDWEGGLEEGALRFARGLSYLHRGLDKDVENRPLAGSDVDRSGEILTFTLHYLAFLFWNLSGDLGREGDDGRAAGWLDAANAVARAQSAVIDAVSTDYAWGSLPDFAGRDPNQPFTTWGCRLHWTVGNEAGELACRHLHQGEDVPETFGSEPGLW